MKRDQDSDDGSEDYPRAVDVVSGSKVKRDGSRSHSPAASVSAKSSFVNVPSQRSGLFSSPGSGAGRSSDTGHHGDDGAIGMLEAELIAAALEDTLRVAETLPDLPAGAGDGQPDPPTEGRPDHATPPTQEGVDVERFATAMSLGAHLPEAETHEAMAERQMSELFDHQEVDSHEQVVVSNVPKAGGEPTVSTGDMVTGGTVKAEHTPGVEDSSQNTKMATVQGNSVSTPIPLDRSDRQVAPAEIEEMIKMQFPPHTVIVDLI